MKLSVIIGHRSLNAMNDTGGDGNDPYHPSMGHEEFAGHVFAQTDADIDCGKPEVAAKAVEYSAESGILLGHSGELPVGTVERVGPDEKHHAYDVPPEEVDPWAAVLIEEEADAGGDADEN